MAAAEKRFRGMCFESVKNMKKQQFTLTGILFLLALLITFAPVSAQNTSSGGAILFGAGETSAWRSGYVAANSSVRYSIYAMAGQSLNVSLSSEKGTAVLGVRDNQGAVYLPPETGSTYWSMTLPATGTYLIDIYGSRTGADAGTAFAFQVFIPPLGQPQNPWIPPVQPTQRPPVVPQPPTDGQSIRFGTGQTSALISGSVQPNGRARYDFYAAAGQHFLVMLQSATGSAVLSVSDNLGNSYLPYSAGYTYWSMVLPQTRSYYVDVIGQGQATDFLLQVVIPARITIPQNTYSASYRGNVLANGVVSYVAYAASGQRMSVNLSSGATPQAFLRISGMSSGEVYLDHTTKWTNWWSYLPATQDYLIEVVGTANPANYQLNVEIR